MLSLDVTATLSKILESSPPQSFIKLHLCQLWPVLVRKHQNKNFLKKKSVRSILRIYVAVTSWKKSEKIP